MKICNKSKFKRNQTKLVCQKIKFHHKIKDYKQKKIQMKKTMIQIIFVKLSKLYNPKI